MEERVTTSKEVIHAAVFRNGLDKIVIKVQRGLTHGRSVFDI